VPEIVSDQRQVGATQQKTNKAVFDKKMRHVRAFKNPWIVPSW
jgi:hypothetical protein